MATVIYKPKAGEELSIDEQKMLEELDSRPISYEKDSPKLTDEELAQFHAVHPELRADPALFKPRKQQITLKLDADLIAAYRATGKGYQTRINSDLRKTAVAEGLIGA